MTALSGRSHELCPPARQTPFSLIVALLLLPQPLRTAEAHDLAGIILDATRTQVPQNDLANFVHCPVAW